MPWTVSNFLSVGINADSPYCRGTYCKCWGAYPRMNFPGMTSSRPCIFGEYVLFSKLAKSGILKFARTKLSTWFWETVCSISDTLAPSLVWEDSSQLMAQPGAWVTLAKQLMAELQQSVSLVECCPLSDGSTPDSWPTSQHRCTGGLVCHQWEWFLLSNALFILNIHTFP